MNVTREDVGKHNMILRVDIAKDDYASKVEEQLKQYRKQAELPGFRKGKVPEGVLRKRFGRSLVAEELDKLINSAIGDFLREQEVNILGSPIPKDEDVQGDFENPGDFQFAYEVGIAPEVSVKLGGRKKMPYYKIVVGDKELEGRIDELTRRYGSLENAEEVGEKDLVLCQFTELENGEPKADGIVNTSTVSVEFLEDEKAKKELLGKKVGDELVMDPRKVSRGDADMAAMLSIDKDAVEGVSNEFKIAINEIRHMNPAEVNEELFGKVYPESGIKDLDGFKAKLKEDWEKQYEAESDRLLNYVVQEHLIDSTKIELPEEFLQKWIDYRSQGEEQQVDFETQLKGVKWELIKNDLVEQLEIKPEFEECVEFTKGMIARNYIQYGLPLPEMTELDNNAKSYLQERDNLRQVMDSIVDTKILEGFKEQYKLDEKEVSFDEFVKIATDLQK